MHSVHPRASLDTLTPAVRASERKKIRCRSLACLEVIRRSDGLDQLLFRKLDDKLKIR